ncbi:hypothetical protein B0H21DRAFT_814943 [Amylocystis lapponica]|nr:hypothetical protein B0H21DRAFT_814943 [Amylocystis lapponica]
MSKDIALTIAGARGSGKASLAAQLHNHCLVRASDGCTFRFVVAHCGETFDPSILRSSGLHFTILTFDLTETGDALHQVALLCRDAQGVVGHSERFLVIGTKSDLIPHDYSYPDMQRRHFTVKCPYMCNSDFRAVSSVDGYGISEVRELIASRLFPLPTKSTWSITGYLQGAATWGLDVIATIFSLPIVHNQDVCRLSYCFSVYLHLFQTPDPVELDHTKVDTLVKGPQTAAWDKRIASQSTFWGLSPTHQIAPTLLAKRFSLAEATNMEYVRTHTTIPVPQPRYSNLSRWLVMDLIDGQSLNECWHTLSPFMQFRIACTLRTYVSQLRRLTSDVPGWKAGETFSGILFEERKCGPFPSSERFQRWCEVVAHSGWGKLVRYHKYNDLPIPPPPVIGDSRWNLVFAHTDLSPSNIVLAKDGTLWIIDWADAGFFPVWLETVGMKRYDNFSKSWTRYRWFIAGCSPAYEWFWEMLLDDVRSFI